MSVISAMLAMIFMMYFNAILSPHLKEVYHISDSNVGFVLAVGAFTYAGASPLVTIVFKNTERRYVSLIAFTMATFSLLVFGPSEMLRLPNSLGLTITGLAFLGIAIALIFVPLLNEIIDSVQEKEGVEGHP